MCLNNIVSFVKRIGDKTPVIQSLIFFPWTAHKIAFPKFLVLWVLSSSPVLISILLSPIPLGELSVWQKFLNKLSDAISISETYVYAAAFISPVFYIVYERYKAIEDELSISEKISQSFKAIFKGYRFVSFAAVLVLIMSIAAYAATKVSTSYFNETFLFAFIKDQAQWLYLYSIICWYLCILDGLGIGMDFVRQTRSGEDSLTVKLGKRISAEQDSL